MPDSSPVEGNVAAIIAELMYCRQLGHPLSADDTSLLETLDRLERCEQAVKRAVAKGEISLGADSKSESENLPDTLATVIRNWMEAQAQWEAAFSTLATRQKKSAKRSGPRGNVTAATTIRIPTSATATKALVSIINTKLWTEQAADEQLITRVPSDGLRVNLSNAIGFDAETAIAHLTRHGASVVQTFLTLASIWREQAGDASYDTYIEVFASDILRHQGRQQTPRGGYHQADTLSKGRDVFILSRLLMPMDIADAGESTTFARFISVEQLETKVSIGTTESYVRFRFHLGEPFQHWMSMLDHGSWDVAGKLLQYHPQRHKYHILLGICLTNLAWKSRYEGRTAAVVSLSEILMLSHLDQHGHRPGAFVSSLEDALQDLNRDGILPGVRLNKPDGWMEMPAAQQARAILERSVISIPQLIGTD
ncbi:MAG: hypothetical protein ACKO14_05100 [Armatimonadota bacterium]